jgi:hypothetical protein
MRKPTNGLGRKRQVSKLQARSTDLAEEERQGGLWVLS